MSEIVVPDFPPTDTPEAGSPKPDPFCHVFLRGSDEPFEIEATPERLLVDAQSNSPFVQLEEDLWVRTEDICAIMRVEPDESDD